MIRLFHGLIARSQRPDPKLLQPKTSSTTLPARLIDVGLDDTHIPRLVDTAGQTGCYVALSHCSSGSRKSSETRLTVSNMSRLQQGIEPSEVSRSVSDAINLTRSLRMRYLWIDALCVVQGDLDGLSQMSDIYRSAVVTVVPTIEIHVIDVRVDSCIDSSVLRQPFSIFLDWSRPTVAKSCSHRLSSPNSGSRLHQPTVEFSHWSVAEFLLKESGNPHGNTQKSDGLSHFLAGASIQEFSSTRQGIEALRRQTMGYGAEPVEREVRQSDTRFDEAGRQLDEGVHHVEAGKNFEALALFMKVKELVSAFQKLTRKSWKLHALASANIALVYQMQHLPVMAHDIAEASLALQSRLPEGECNYTFE